MAGAQLQQADEPTVTAVRRIGTSVRGRPIRAYRLGDRTSAVDALRRGPPVRGNARGVDLNRNFRRNWAPLTGHVGRAGERWPFVRRLSDGLGLPVRSFDCSGECHGTMTSCFNANHAGTAVTVEFGRAPSLRYLRGKAARGTLRAVLGRRWSVGTPERGLA